MRSSGVPRTSRWLSNSVLYTSLIAVFTLAGCTQLQAKADAKPSMDKQAMMNKIRQLQKMAPGRGYLEAHNKVSNPLGLLGGPITVRLTQSLGGVHVALPDNRRLDPRVFGTPAMPRAFGGTPGINGVPPMVRGAEGGRYTAMKAKSPFGDKSIVMGNGKLMLVAVDATATDAATSKDSVRFRASWQDKAGNTYMVKCCAKLAVHGLEYPTFGGVVTNHIMHGFSRIGTALMPTMFSYVAFWGMGEVSQNGRVLDKPRLVHGMLTEYVRTEGYKLAFDHEVTPTRLHFHLMVPPMKPVVPEGRFEHSPVKTGFILPNGKQLPFWHVMFSNLKVEAQRG